MPVGPNKTTGGLSGMAPQQNLTGYTRTRRKEIFYSLREIALLIQKTLRGGFGSLESGTVMAQETTNDYLVPYVPDTIDQDDVGRAMLIQDCSTSDEVDLLIADSYRFEAGDAVVLTDTDGTYETAEVSSIDRTTYNYKAVITLTGATSNNFTTAKSACIYHKAGTSSKYSTAKYILDQDIFTGDDKNVETEGGLTSVLLSNAVLYSGEIVGMDSQAKSDLGNVTEDGQFYIVK
ncbi:MAG: hypothetical protein ABXS91_10965 [Sulfurimonas sp.]